MPANRSRTEHWRDNLAKVLERGGSLELAIAPPFADGASREPEGPGESTAVSSPPIDDGGSDVVWRVKLLALREDAMVVEQPSAFGRTFRLQPNVELIGAMTIGQNRWMFHTRTLSSANAETLTLALPARVERCTRRSFYRISTAGIRLPRVQCWSLLNPASVGPAEAANRAYVQGLLRNGEAPIADASEVPAPESILLPEVGPMFHAQLLNLSGGGLGLMVDRSDMQAATAKPFWWLRVDLRPDIPAPIAVSVRLAHTHIDSTQALYCGLAFDFSHDPAQREFIIDVFGRFTDELQRRQLRKVRAA